MKDSKKINNYSNGTFEFQIKQHNLEEIDTPTLVWDELTRDQAFRALSKDRFPYQVRFIIVEK